MAPAMPDIQPSGWCVTDFKAAEPIDRAGSQPQERNRASGQFSKYNTLKVELKQT